LIGALLMARQKDPNPRRLALASAAFGIATLLVAYAPTLTAELLLLVPMGFASMIFMITGNSTLQLTSRPDMRGRVMALYGIVFLGSTPIGGPIAGWLSEHLGARATLALGGLVAIAVGAVGLLIRSVRSHSARSTRPSWRRPDGVARPASAGAVTPQLSTDDAVAR